MESGQRTDNFWDFVTLSEFIGLNENWSGTGNIPLTIILMLLAFFVVWKKRYLKTVPLLSLALTASLFCAPRAYTYNFTFLIPLLLLLSLENKKFANLIWLLTAIISVVSGYSTGAFLIVVMVLIVSFIQANQPKLKTKLAV